MSELFEQARIFGYADIPKCESCFQVWINNNQPIRISTYGQPMHVYWNGSSLIVEMDSGQVRRYYDVSADSYTIIKDRYQ